MTAKPRIEVWTRDPNRLLGTIQRPAGAFPGAFRYIVRPMGRDASVLRLLPDFIAAEGFE